MDGTTIVYSGIDLVNFQDEISDKGNSENPDKNDDNEYDDSNVRNPVKEIDDPDDSSLNGPDTVHHRGVINRNILSLQEELDDCDEEFIHTTVLTSSSSSEGSLSDEHETLPIESNTKRRFGSSRRCMFAKTGMNTKDNSRNEIQNNEIQTPELDIESDMEISSPEESSTNDVVNKLNDNPQIEPSDDTKRKTSGSYTGYEVSDDDPDSRPPSTGLIPAEEKLSGRTDQNELCSGNEMISDKDEPDLKEVASYASSPCHRPHQTDDEGITDDMDMTSICHPDTSEDMAPSSGQGTSTENVDDTNLDCKLGNQVNTLSQNDRPNEVKAFKQNITSQQATGREKQTSAQNRGKTSEDPDAESKTQSDIDKVEHTTIPGEGYQESHNITMADNFSLKQDDMKTDINTIIYTSDQVKSTGNNNNNNTFGQVLGQTNSDIGDEENYGRQTPVAKEVVDATDNTQIIRDVPLDVENQPTVNNPEHVNYTNVISASPEVVNLTNNDMSRRVTASTTATDVQERDKISPTPQWLEQNSGSADAHIRNEETDLTMINVTGSPNTSPAPNIARLDYFQSEANVPGQEEIFSESQTSVVETELTTSCLRELAETNLLNGTVQGNNAPLSVNNGLGVRTSGQFNDCPETSLSEQGVISTKLCASDEISVPSDLNAVSGYVKDLGGNEESRNPEATSSSQIQSNTNKQGYLLAQGVVSKSLPPSTGNFSGARTVSGNETEDASELRNPGEVTISLGESTASDLVYDRDYSKICDGKVIVCQTAQGRIQLTESTDGCNVTSGQGAIVQNTDFVNRENNEVIRPNVPQYNASTQNEAFRQNATSPQTVTMESHRIVQSPGNIPSQSGIRGLNEVGSLRQSNYTSDSGDVFYTQSENNKMETGAYQQTNMLSQANSLTRTDPTGHHNMLVRQDIDGSYPVIVGQDEVMGRAYPMREVSVTNPIIQRMPARVVSPSGIDMTGRSNVSHFNNTPAQRTTFLGAEMSGEDESSLGMDVSSNISTTTTHSMLLYRNPSDSQVPLQVGNTGTNDTSSFTLSYPNIGSITHTQVGCNTPGSLIHCPVNHQADEGVVCYGPGTTSTWQTGTGMGQSTLDVTEAGYQYTNSDQRSSMQFNNSNNFKGKTDDGLNLGITQRRIPAHMKTGIDNVPSQNVNRTEQESDTSAQIVRNAHPEIDKPIKVSAPRETSTVNQRHLENVVNVSANPQSEIDKVGQVNISAKIYQESQPTTTMRMMTNDVVLSTQSNVQMTTTDQLGQGIKPTGDNMFIQDPGQTIPSIVRQDRLTSQIAVPREVTYADSVHTRHTGSLEVNSPSEANSSRHIVRHSSEMPASYRDNIYPGDDMAGQRTTSERHIVGDGTDISVRGQVIQGYAIPTDSIDAKVPHEMDDGIMVDVSMSSSTPLDQSDTITTNVQIDWNAPRQVHIPSGYGISVNSDDLIRDNLVKRSNESAMYGVIPPRDTASAQTNIRAYGCNVSGYVPFMERNAETHLPETNRPIAPEQVLRSHDHDRVSTSIYVSERENSYPGSDKIHDTVNNPSLFSNREALVKPPTTSEQNDIFLNIETMAEARPVTENIPQHQVTNNARVPDNRPGQRAFFYPEPTSVVHEYTATQVDMAIDNNPFIHPAGVPSTLSRDHEHSTQLDVHRNDRDVLGGGTSPQLGGYYQTSKSGLEDCQSSRMIVEGRREVPTRQFSGHVTAPNVAILNPAVSKFEPNPRIINQSANVQNTESVSGYNDKVHAQRVEPSQGIPVRSNLGQEANYIIHPEAQRPRSDNVLDERNIHFCLEENSRHLNSGQQYLSSDHRKALSRLNSGNFSSLESDAIFQPYEARDSHGYTADFRYESGTATFQPIRGLPPDCHEINGYVTRTRDSGHPSHLYCTDQSETIVINRPRPIYADSERQFVLEGQGHSPNNVSQKSVPSDQMHDSLDQVGTVEADSGSCTDRCRDNGHSKVPITDSKKPYGIHQDIRNDDVCVSSDLGSKRGDNWKEFVDSALDDGFSASLARDNSAFHRRPSRRSSSSKLKRTRERVSRCVQIYTERLLLWDVVGCGESGPIQKLLYLMLQNLVWKCLGDPAW